MDAKDGRCTAFALNFSMGGSENGFDMPGYDIVQGEPAIRFVPGNMGEPFLAVIF